MNFEQWYVTQADPNVGIVEDRIKRAAAQAAWTQQQKRIDELTRRCETLTRVNETQALTITELQTSETQAFGRIEALENRIPGLEQRADEGDRIVSQLGKARAEAAEAQRTASENLHNSLHWKEECEKLTEQLQLAKVNWSTLDKSCEQWRRRYTEECEKRDVDRQKLRALECENNSLRASNEEISAHNMALQDTIERQAKIIWPDKHAGQDNSIGSASLWPQDAIRDGMAAQTMSSTQPKEPLRQPLGGGYYGAILANSPQPTDKIKRCAAFAKNEQVTVEMTINGIRFVICGG